MKDKSQAQRFKDAAREVECDETPEAFERVFAKVVPPKAGVPSARKGLTRKTPKRQ